jgi:formate dehydrogenase major subunit
MKIDGRRAPAEGTVLDACRAVGVEVPALCSADRLSPGGHCRSCLVEIDGRVVAACTTPATSGMDVRTDTERLRGYREDLGELLLAESSPRGSVRLAIEQWGAHGLRYHPLESRPHPGAGHPYLRIDLDRCIRCRLCIRACDEIQGQLVYSMTGRGSGSAIDWGGATLAEGGCVSCGACASVCPTMAITDVDRERAEHDAPTRTVRTTCGYCGVGCQLDVFATEEDVVRIDGAASPVNAGHLCLKGRYAHGFVRHPDRLRTPLIRRNGSLSPATWPEALEYVAGELDRLRGRVAGLSSSRCTNEENYLFQKWMRGGLGTHDVDCCARVCHAPSARGMRNVLGTGAATNSLEDLDVADLILVVGSNTTEAHPVTGARIKRAALSGTTLIVIDPRRTELAALADVHLQLRPGTNVLLLNSLAHVLIEEGLVDTSFVASRCEGFDELSRHLMRYSPETTESTTLVPASTVRRSARLLGRAQRPMQVHGLGITEHHQGSEAVMLLCNLALLTGAIGRPGVGVNPLRGQNNVQGAADMGCQPDLLTGYLNPEDPAVRARVESLWGRPLPTAPGRTIPRIYDAIFAGELRALVVLGEDVVQTDNNATRVRAALERLELLVVQEIFLSETAKLAHVVLPGASFLEKDGTFTNGERRIQRVRRVVDPPGDARPDWRIVCDLMAATGFPQPYEGPADIFAEIARVAPLFAGAAWHRLEGDGLQWPVPSPEHPGTSILHGEGFPLGKARLACVDYVPSPSLVPDAPPLLLTTGRVLEHYNTSSMTRRTADALLAPSDELELHPVDAHARGIEDGMRVTVESRFGKARARARVTDRVSRGTAFLSFHFPETGTNQVTSDVLDRLADCPEYKLVPVEVRRA